MEHIYLIDDYPGKTKELIRELCCFLETNGCDTKVHLLIIRNKTEAENMERICKKFKIKLDKQYGDYFDYETITYSCPESIFYDRKEKGKILKEIFSKIDEKEPHLVAVDLMLLGSTDDGRIKKNGLEAEKRVLSHEICENYSGYCVTYSYANEQTAKACFNRWKESSRLDDKVKEGLMFFHTGDHSGDFSKIACEMYGLIKD